MHRPRPQPVDSLENLRGRIDRLFSIGEPALGGAQHQAQLDFLPVAHSERPIAHPSKSIVEFLNFFTDVLPDGDVYLFGGVLRDVAFFGRRGFASDIDLVVEGDWHHGIKYLASLGAERNKFGGYRLQLAGWPVDVWHATDTWAIREGFVPYRSIASLTETTVLNWDAILMNWRTRAFVCREGYLNDLRKRILDVVLIPNPNPLGMTVRVFRHLCSKEATSITAAAERFLADSTIRYSYAEITAEEMRSYGTCEIRRDVYERFEHVSTSSAPSLRRTTPNQKPSADFAGRELQLI